MASFVYHTISAAAPRNFHLGAVAQEVWGQKCLSGYRGEAPVGNLGAKYNRSWNSLQTLFADFDCKNFENFAHFIRFLTNLFAVGLSEILRGLSPQAHAWPFHCTILCIACSENALNFNDRITRQLFSVSRMSLSVQLADIKTVVTRSASGLQVHLRVPVKRRWFH